MAQYPANRAPHLFFLIFPAFRKLTGNDPSVNRESRAPELWVPSRRQGAALVVIIRAAHVGVAEAEGKSIVLAQSGTVADGWRHGRTEHSAWLIPLGS